MKNVCVIFIAMCLLGACREQADIHVTNLRCELLHDPQGIEHATPRLSWEIAGDSVAYSKRLSTCWWLRRSKN